MNESDLQPGKLGDHLSAKEVNTWLAMIPYARLIGVEAEDKEDALIFTLQPKSENVGNPLLPALHGGVVAAYLETAAILNVMAYTQGKRIPKIIDFSIDYLRSARTEKTYARCELGRLGKRVVNVSITAWQGDREAEPIALARAHLIWPEI
ncbi:PaaI family thioesterase [Marinospirillum insulare]|uniref:Thioesterase n=1 Tax=Marinospirillum insulare TaxID=217169 RepID=A0ABQ5ZZK3_9GAMM|nr:PaaI family thioesterase [Marinospirillum insulare]GLR64455.1 thioesterase [Marinospirillum insulare]